jgi:hypothetical protein
VHVFVDLREQTKRKKKKRRRRRRRRKSQKKKMRTRMKKLYYLMMYYSMYLSKIHDVECWMHFQNFVHPRGAPAVVTD